MKFTTIRLANKRSQIRLEAKVKYELFSPFQEKFVIENNKFIVDEGNKFFDLIGDQGPLKFVSEKFKTIFEENKIAGITFYPIIIDGVDLSYYFYTLVECNSIYEKDEDGDRIYGTFQVDMSSWDGSEIFYLKDSGATVCSLRVKEIIEKNKLSNIEFEDLSEY